MAKPVRGIGTPAARYLLLGSALFLSLYGLVMIYSASSVADYVHFGDSAYHLKRQLGWMATGLLAMIVLARVDYRRFRVWAWGLLLASDIGLVLVLTHGVGKWGAQRWLYFGPVGLQPSEFAKLACVLSLAVVLSDKRMRREPFTRKAAWFAAILMPPVVLIMLQPDMGTTMSILVASYLVFALGGVEGRYLAGVAAAGIAAVPAMIFFEPYRAARFLAFMDPWADPRRGGYQIIQAMLAFGSGGLTGVGLGLSRQKFFYLPAAHTDFIFAIIGEELGLLGTLAVVAAFLVLAYAGFRVAVAAKDPFGRLVAAGLTSLIVTQAVMNMAAVTNIMPVTGIPLPLMSYGGSSVVFTMGCVGLILSVARHGSRGRVRAAKPRPPEEGTPIARTAEWRRYGGSHLSSADGGRAPSRKRA
jgi:cell division protein FtsW